MYDTETDFFLNYYYLFIFEYIGQEQKIRGRISDPYTSWYMQKEHPIIHRERQCFVSAAEPTREREREREDCVWFRVCVHCLRCGLMASTAVLACSYQLHECTS